MTNPYPDYELAAPVPKQTSDDELFSQYLPITRNTKAAGAAQFSDELQRLDPRAHDRLRTAVPVYNAVDKLGSQMAAFDYVIIGEGRHAEELQKIFDQVHRWPELCRSMAWVVAEGARYAQYRPVPDREDHYTTLTFADGVRRKFLASDPSNGEGSVHSDGNNIYQVRLHTGLDVQEATLLDPRWWLQFRFGLTGNPEGDTLLARVLYPLADAWHKFFGYALERGELYGVPMRILRNSQPWKTRKQELVDAMMQSVETLVQAKGGDTVHIGEQEVALLALANGVADLAEFLEQIGEWVYRLVLHNTLTSTVSNADRTGNTMVHLSEEQRAGYNLAASFCEASGPSVLNTLVDLNQDLLPRRLKSEPAPYLWPIPAGLRKKGELFTEEDLVDPSTIHQNENRIETALEGSSNGNGKHN